MATPPTCRRCDTKHWSTQPCGVDSKASKPRPDTPSLEAVQRDQKEATFTNLVTQVAPIKVTQHDTNKVTRHRGRPRIKDEPLTPAEKMRRYRERKKALQSST